MSLIPSPRRDFRVARIGAGDAKRGTAALRLLQQQLDCQEEMYPDISNWFKKKVLPGLKHESRIAFIGYDNERPIITAIIKRGARTKFCHLRIADEFQDLNLGQVFFSLMAIEARHSAKEIHFTLPESLWLKRRDFFYGFGFGEATPSRVQYRLFEEELSCSAPFSLVWRCMLDRIPTLASHFSINRYDMHPRLLLSVKPDHAEKIMDGKKTIEIRRRFAAKWSRERVAIYSTSPVKALIGEATIQAVTNGSPKEIWERYGTRICCSHSEFLSYAEDCADLYALELSDAVPYMERIPLIEAESLIRESLAPPQSYCEVNADRPWAKALSLAALLHGSLQLAGFNKSLIEASSPIYSGKI